MRGERAIHVHPHGHLDAVLARPGDEIVLLAFAVEARRHHRHHRDVADGGVGGIHLVQLPQIGHTRIAPTAPEFEVDGSPLQVAQAMLVAVKVGQHDVLPRARQALRARVARRGAARVVHRGRLIVLLRRFVCALLHAQGAHLRKHQPQTHNGNQRSTDALQDGQVFMQGAKLRQRHVRCKRDDDERYAQPQCIHQKQPRAHGGAPLLGRQRQNGSQNRPDARRPAERERQAQHERAKDAAHLDFAQVRSFFPIQEGDADNARQMQAEDEHEDAQRDGNIGAVERRPQRARARAQRHEHAADAQHERDGVRAAAAKPERVGRRVGGEHAHIHRQQRQNARREERQ